MQSAKADRGRFLYAHEVPTGSLPGLVDTLRVPKYFLSSFNELDSTPDADVDAVARSAQHPALFFGPAGTSTPLHSDGAPLRCAAPAWCIGSHSTASR